MSVPICITNNTKTKCRSDQNLYFSRPELVKRFVRLEIKSQTGGIKNDYIC